MRRHLITCLLLLQGMAIWAQNFSPKDTLTLPNMITPVFEWVDIDNDGLLDMFVTGRDLTVGDSSRSISYIYHQQTDTSFNRVDVDLETYGEQLIRLVDLNMDGRQDILISATGSTAFEHVIYQNNGDLTFEKKVLNINNATAWSELRLADLDNDGVMEIITSSPDGMLIYKSDLGNYTAVDFDNELSKILTDPVILDFDQDGFLDVYLTGTKSDGDSVALMLLNDKEFAFEVRSLKSDSLKITDYVVSDFNDDGLPDLLASHDINDEMRSLELLINQGGAEFEPATINDRVGLRNAKVFAADLTSDGLIDTDIEGSSIGNSGILFARERVIETPSEIISQRDTLAGSTGQGRRYADFDFDGDLDYFEVTTNLTGSRLWLFNNDQEIMNEGPNQLEDLLAFRFQNVLYLVWNMAADDFTESPSVTYDVAIGTRADTVDVLAAGFDPLTLKRTITGPGNQGSNPFLILNNAPIQPLTVSILPIDNAFHYNTSETLGGTLGNSCSEELMVQEKVLCGTNQIVLTTETGEEARWFSASKGYLGIFSTLNYTTSGRDFIIAVYDRVGGCIDGEVFELIPEAGLALLPDLTICPEESVNTQVPGQWESVVWTSEVSGLVSSTSTLNYLPTDDDVITVDVVSATGCSYQQVFSVTIDEVIASVQDSVLQIDEGESVQLLASGGTEYSWNPPLGLSNISVANPIAIPDQTTLYTVTVINDTGCTDQTDVLVEVTQTAFVPDMFSPNGDSRNEVFRVYDLEAAANLEFSIFDRAGNKVFESSSLNEVTVRGWDGTKDGRELPTGTYFWRITGQYESGQEIMLNGKKSGALQLIR